MQIDAALAAELALLTAAIDDPDIDVAAGLLRLAANARAAVPSYRGLSVVIAHSASPIAFTIVEDGIEQADIRTSLMLVMPDDRPASTHRVSLILFAGVPGAFVDLAADLAWMTGRRLAEIVLDQHLDHLLERRAAETLQSGTVVNQAIGVLIGRGFTPEQAVVELEARAAEAGTDRYRAAAAVLTSIPAVDEGPFLDPA